jgi:hypothetical protein
MFSEKLKDVLDLGEGTALEYKNHSTSMKDRSTFRNTKAYVFAAMSGADVYPRPGTCCSAQRSMLSIVHDDTARMMSRLVGLT